MYRFLRKNLEKKSGKNISQEFKKNVLAVLIKRKSLSFFTTTGCDVDFRSVSQEIKEIGKLFSYNKINFFSLIL